MIIEKDGQIIVNELRPMSEYPKNQDGDLCVFVLVFLSYAMAPALVACYRDKEWAYKYEYYGIGWIPLPIYQPQQKQEPVYLECGE